MSDLSFFKLRYGIDSADAAFEKFVSTLQNYYDADYYVDWKKVFAKLKPLRFELSLLSALCDEPNKEESARELLREYPKVIKAFPVLMACRNSVEIVDDISEARVTSYNFTHTSTALTETEIERYVKFLTTSGVLSLLGQINSVPDYVTGVEVGMDTNGRKNRGGECGIRAIYPFILEAQQHIPELCIKSEASFSYLTSQGFQVPEKFDGVVWDLAFWIDSSRSRLTVMEVNHYGSSGSKPPAIAREYIERQPALDEAGIGFIWVTDGRGWHKMRKPLRAAFDSLHYLININLAREGLLKWALCRLLLTEQIPHEELPSPLYTSR